MADAGQSVPDKTNADNPSKTGTPTVKTQGSDSDQNPGNRTMPYGGQNAKVAQGKDEKIEDVAERQVIERGGEQIRNNPNFKTMVEDEVKQMKQAIDNTQG